MSSRSWFCCAVLVLATAGPVSAQPPAPPSSPLALVRGIREAGMPDLALKYLDELDNNPNKPMTDVDKKAIPLERAKCLLDAAEDEPDESTRISMVGEAKDGFNDFLVKNAGHPRVSEASLALARLTSIEAKTQLNAARRMDVPPKEDPGHDAALAKQRAEALKAQPLFLLASKNFAAAAKQMKEKLDDPKLDPLTRQTLTREAFEADLAAGINQFYLADTFISADAKLTIQRGDLLEDARKKFSTMATGQTSRTAWIARAWMAETLLEMGKGADGEEEFRKILASGLMEAEEGKRMVRFFQVRRAYLGSLTERTAAKLQASEKLLRNWLGQYGNRPKPTPEVFSMRYYLAYTLQIEAELASPKTGSVKVDSLPYREFSEAEKLYRVLSQSDNDYTVRSSRNRMFVVRKLLGEADKPAGEYPTFESAQMAALIQMAKLGDAEKTLANAKAALPKLVRDGKAFAAIGADFTERKNEHEIKDRKARILALLERARELATDQDSPGDVIDNLLRLVYFYQTSNQPYQAAVLGEYVLNEYLGAKKRGSSGKVLIPGGKAATAGLMAMSGYTIASTKVKADASNPDPEAAAAVASATRKVDREHAINIARLLDANVADATATDAARHRLASLLTEDKLLEQAYETIVKVRPGYVQVNNARLLEGYVAWELIRGKDVALPGGKPAVFRKATADLERTVKPATIATEEEVRPYLLVRVRLAQLYLIQSRAEGKETELAGYDKALRVGGEIVAAVPTFDCLVDKETKKLNVEGREMLYQGLDVLTRAIYLRGRVFVDAKPPRLAEAAAALDPAIEDVKKNGPTYDATMKQWAAGMGDADDKEADLALKAKVASLAAGIDKARRDVVMVGFKLRVRQGNPTAAGEMLALLEKAGGSVEESQSILELMARELAAQIATLKKTGQAAEAKTLGDGLAILLKRLTAIPNLTTASILFLGQTLYLVEQYEDARKQFEKLPVPKIPNPSLGTEWWRLDVNKLPNDAGKKKFQDEIRDYRVAQLYLARAFRGEKKFAESEKLLKDAIGPPPPEKPGYAYSSLDFRKELALLHEARAATLPTAKEANPEWGAALKEWTTLFNYAKNRLGNLSKESWAALTLEHEKLFWFKLTESSFAALRKEKVPEPVLTKLNPLKDKGFSRGDLLGEIAKVLDAAESAQFQNLLLNHAEKIDPPNKNSFSDLLIPAKLALANYATEDKRYKNGFYDAYLDVERCLIQANVQLLPKGNPNLAKTFAAVGKRIADIEADKAAMELLTPEVAIRYYDLLEKYPELKTAYKAAGGKLFLEKPKE